MIWPSFAYAHVGIDAQSGWVHGFIHPLGGWDHILTMAGVGLWATQMGRSAIWQVPLIFVAVMILGGAVGMIALPFPYAEAGIIISLLVFGILIAAQIRLPLFISIFVVSVFAFCHGYAHGAEMPHHVPGLTYAVGFVSATALLHACGIAIAVLTSHRGRAQLLRPVGVVVALYGSSILLIG